MVFGRWSKNSDKWDFIIKNEEALDAKILVGEEYKVFDSDWGERIEIVIDTNKKWSKESFKAKDGNNHDHWFFLLGNNFGV